MVVLLRYGEFGRNVERCSLELAPSIETSAFFLSATLSRGRDGIQRLQPVFMSFTPLSIAAMLRHACELPAALVHRAASRCEVISAPRLRTLPGLLTSASRLAAERPALT